MTASKEDYLRIIWVLSDQGQKSVHSVEIGKCLHVSRASVSDMTDKLKERGYIEKKPYAQIKLTEKGVLSAKDIVKKYQTIQTFLTDVIGIKTDQAKRDACKMEHAMSFETVIKLEEYIQTERRRKTCQEKMEQDPMEWDL